MNYITVDGRFCVHKSNNTSYFPSTEEFSDEYQIINGLPPLRDCIDLCRYFVLLTQDDNLLVYRKGRGLDKTIPNIKSIITCRMRLIVLSNDGFVKRFNGDIMNPSQLFDNISEIFPISYFSFLIVLNNHTFQAIDDYVREIRIKEIKIKDIIKVENGLIYSSEKIYLLKDDISDDPILIEISNENVKSAISTLCQILVLYEDGTLKLHSVDGVKEIRTDIIIRRFITIGERKLIEDIHGNLYNSSIHENSNILEVLEEKLPMRPIQQGGIGFKSLKSAQHR